MPKNKKPAGGRPARNFDPSYARASAKPGSRSKGHRGHRPDEAEARAKAPRWTREERIAGGRTEHRSERTGRFERDDRAPRRLDRDDRTPRRDADRTDRPARGFDRDDRAPRRYDDRNERTPRQYDRNDRTERPTRRFDDRTDRPARSHDRDDRAPRQYDRHDRSDRPARRFDDRTDRPARSHDRDDRAPRRFDDRGDRPARSHDRNDRAPRRFDDRGDRPARRDFDRREHAARRDPQGGDRAPRRFDDRGDRPARSHDRNDRAPRRFDRDDRAPRRFDDRGDRRPSQYFPAQDQRAGYAPADDVVLERLEAQSIQAGAVEGVDFGDLGLGQNIVRALRELGAEHPFPIQAATIPVVLEGRDVLGRGRTGSGKTIAFGAPTVERLMQQWAGQGDGERRKRAMGRSPRALILAPTRELALQIDRTVQPIAQAVGLFTTQVYGGVPQGRQVGALRRGVDIVIGTPGRIEDLERQGHLDLSSIEITVLDEADHMCDLGFLEPVQRILRMTRDGGQKLLFSATLDTGVAALVDEFLVDPAVHEVAGEDQASSTIEHRVFVIDHRDKRDVVALLADRDGKTLVFARTRAFAEDLAEHLEDRGLRTVALHGDLNQAKRTRNLQQLTSGRVDVLVATDVAARGIHVDDIDLVVQADAPDEYKTYLHRAGRTGRAGRSGRVVTLIPRNRQRRMSELLERAEIEVDFEDVRLGDEVLRTLEPAAIESEAASDVVVDADEVQVEAEVEAEAEATIAD
ncbi:DEAD/DEAH box helicase [Agromyces sp. MMS24-JH15]|uniref:DEAD/DEAH box helicase n=1 Tax=Agromyces sp. MMS24-JH15 TaxID=3243765 RepID=UPI003748BBFE